jgi:hypothetical protein
MQHRATRRNEEESHYRMTIRSYRSMSPFRTQWAKMGKATGYENRLGAGTSWFSKCEHVDRWASIDHVCPLPLPYNTVCIASAALNVCYDTA